MAAPRFYVEQALAAGACIDLPAAVAHHACAVLRLRAGDPIVVFNGQGGEYRGRLAGQGRGADPARAELLEYDAADRECASRVTLIQALAASDKIDWVIEKAVELGVVRVIVTAAARSTVRLDADRRERRLRHWRELVVAACCQCGRNRLPQVRATASFEDALREAADAEFKWLLEPSGARGLPVAPAPSSGGAVFAIGPEGGFDAGELELASHHGFASISLGPRVLRTETAGLAAAAAWFALNGEYRAG